MSAPDEDFVQRSRSIFERLRAEQEDPSREGTDAESPDAEPRADSDAGPSEPLDGVISPAMSEFGDRDVVPEGDPETAADRAKDDHDEPAGEFVPPASAADAPVAGDSPAPEVAPEAAPAADRAVTPADADESQDQGVSGSEVDADDTSTVSAEPVPGADEILSATTAPPDEDLVAGDVGGDGDDEPAGSAVVADVPASGTAPDLVPEQAVASPEPATPPDPDRFRRPLPRVLAIANQKGGVGKTTTTVNLGASLAVLGYRVLVVDLDPQGNATTGLGINSRNLEASIYDVILHDTPLEDAVEPTSLRNLFVAPATIDLAGAEIELVPAFSRELRLRRALEDVRDNYDFVLIDCPPSLGLLTVNALSAASEVVVPIQCEYYALEGLGQLLRNINLVQANLNPKLELSAIILTMYDARTKLAEQVADEVRQHFGDRVCRNVVPRTVRLSEAPSFGQPIIVFDPSSRGALAYRELAKEVSGGAPQRTG